MIHRYVLSFSNENRPTLRGTAGGARPGTTTWTGLLHILCSGLSDSEPVCYFAYHGITGLARTGFGRGNRICQRTTARVHQTTPGCEMIGKATNRPLVMKLRMSVYGLHQSPSVWISTIRTDLTDLQTMGSTSTASEPLLLHKREVAPTTPC